MQPLSAPTTKVTVLLFDDDIAQLKTRYGRGWTEQVRLMVQKNCQAWKKCKRTLEDIMTEQPNGH